MAADTYPCHKVDMLSYLSLADLGLTLANDIWGWTDPVTGVDYALVGGGEGLVVVDIGDPKRPHVVGMLPTHTQGAFIWRDLKVYNDHVFVVSEDPGHGVQVLDLTQVRGLSGDPVVFSETAHYDGVGSSHNIGINEDTGYAYVIGAAAGTESGCSGGLHMIDISDPDAPTFAGCFSDRGYIHDTQCVIYEGPDVDHQGREICFNAAAEFFGFSPEGIVNTVSIVDVTDKSNPVELSVFEYANDGYSHQGWLTPDHEYFLHNDELDEFFGQVGGTVTRIFDVRDLDNPVAPVEVVHSTASIGHNAYTEGSHLFASNYTAGLRVFSLDEVADGELPEEAYFDVYPANDNGTFEGGTWSNYPYFSQKKVVAVTSIERGLFILQPRVGS
jgi:choice-of-anchor B domain-containing protein